MPRRNPFAPPRPRRRRSPFGGSARNSAAPRPIKMVQPKLDISGLSAAYEWLVIDKPLGYQLAFEWYSANMASLLFGDPLDADRQRNYDRATKAKLLGDSSNYEGEKLQAWTTSLHKYEEVWKKRSLPTIDEALKQTTPSKRMTAIQGVLDALNGAFKAEVPDLSLHINYSFAVTSGTEREFYPNKILLPQKELDTMIGASPLNIVMAEVITVAKLASVVEVDGQQELDGGIFMATLPALIAHVATWADTYNGALTKPFGKAYVTKTPRVTPSGTPSTPRAPRANAATGAFPLTAIVTVLVANSPQLKGKRAAILAATSTGMSVADFYATAKATQKFNRGAAADLLNIFVSKGIVTVA